METLSPDFSELQRRQGRRRQVLMALNPIFLRFRRMAGPILHYWLHPSELEVASVEKNYGHWVRVAKERWYGQIAMAQFFVAALSTGLLFVLAMLMGD